MYVADLFFLTNIHVCKRETHARTHIHIYTYTSADTRTAHTPIYTCTHARAHIFSRTFTYTFVHTHPPIQTDTLLQRKPPRNGWGTMAFLSISPSRASSPDCRSTNALTCIGAVNAARHAAVAAPCPSAMYVNFCKPTAVCVRLRESFATTKVIEFLAETLFSQGKHYFREIFVWTTPFLLP